MQIDAVDTVRFSSICFLSTSLSKRSRGPCARHARAH
jgi:hypothetical protein